MSEAEYKKIFFQQITFPDIELFPKFCEFRTSKRGNTYAMVEFNRNLIKEDFDVLDAVNFMKNTLVKKFRPKKNPAS